MSEAKDRLVAVGLSLLSQPIFQPIIKSVSYLLEFAQDPKGAADKLGTYLTDTLGSMEGQVSDDAVGLLKHFGLTDAEANQAKALIDSMSSSFGAASPLLRVLMGVRLLFGIQGNVLDGIKPLITKAVRKVVKAETGDIQTLLHYLYRTDNKETFMKLWEETGLPFDWSMVANTALRPLPDPQTLQEEYRRRGLVDRIPIVSDLQKLGYSEKHAIRLAELSKQMPDIGVLVENWKRRILDDDEFADQASKLGIDDNYQTYIKWATQQLPGLGELLDLRRRNVIPDEFRLQDELAKLGYDKNDTERISQLTWRPLDIISIREAWLRGIIDEDQFNTQLQKAAYGEPERKIMKELSWLPPTPTDLIRMGVREVFTPEIAERFGQFEDFPEAMIPWGKKVGLNEEVLKMYWAAHWNLPSAGQGFDMFHRGIINHDDLVKLLRALDVMPYWQGKMIDLAYRLVPRRQVGWMLEEGTVDLQGAATLYGQLGFAPDTSQKLAEVQRSRQLRPERNKTRNAILASYTDDIIGRSEAQRMLATLGFAADQITAWIVYRDGLKYLKSRADALESEPDIDKEARKVSKGEILRAYRSKVIDADEATGLLYKLGYTRITGKWLLGLEDLRIAEKRLESVQKQVRRQYDAHLLSDTEANAKLTGYGVAPAQAIATVEAWSLERSTDDMIAKADQRQPSKADLARWIKRGIISTEQYTQRLQVLNYADNDVVRYLEEVYLEVVQSNA